VNAIARALRVSSGPARERLDSESASAPTADRRMDGGKWRGNGKKSFGRLCLCVGGGVVVCLCARVFSCRCVFVCTVVVHERARDPPTRGVAQTGDECVNCVCARQVERGGSLCDCALSDDVGPRERR